MKTPALERYHNDPAFRRLVDTFFWLLQSGDYTPSELREAAILAATKLGNDATADADRSTHGRTLMARKDPLLEKLTEEAETALRKRDVAVLEATAACRTRDLYVEAKRQAAERRGKKATATE